MATKKLSGRATRAVKSGAVVRSLSRTEKLTIAEAERQLRKIASTPITAAQRMKAQELVEKAKRADESEVTAKFRRAPDAA